MRTYKCKNCNFTAEGNSPYVLRAHAREVHGKTNGARRPRALRAVEAAAAIDVDKEASLIARCVDLFNNAGTTRDADFRVLEYLACRFGPAAYADETVADEPEPVYEE